MEFLKKLDISGVQFMKLIALVLIVLVVLSLLLSMFRGTMGMNALSPNVGTKGVGYDSVSQAPSYYGGEDAYEPELSLRNMGAPTMPPQYNGYTEGDLSEAFEVKEYSAHIETRDLERDCETLHALKARGDVIFENANSYERGCSYVFKVKKGSVEDVLRVIQDLNPRDLTESTYTIKREVDDYTSEIQILENKLASLDSTLADAIASYENITSLATGRGDVESLAKIIESKLTIIERLTAARIDTVNGLERMNRAKAEALDRLEYTYFSVSIYKNEFINGTDIKDSWKAAVQTFVRETNKLIQDISIGVVTLLLILVKFTLYFVILLFVARFGWTFTRKVWNDDTNTKGVG